MTYSRKVQDQYQQHYHTGLLRGVSLLSVIQAHNAITGKTEHGKAARKGIRRAIRQFVLSIEPMTLPPVVVGLKGKPNFFTKLARS